MLDLMVETNTLHVKKTPEAVAAAALIKEHQATGVQGLRRLEAGR